MGIHLYSASRNMRTPQAHLERKENGDVYGVLKQGFKKESKRFEYCFLGREKGKLYYDGKKIENHPEFDSISKFQNWCMRYAANNDLK